MLHAAGEIAINLVAVFIVFVARLFGLDLYSRLLRTLRLAALAVRRFRGERAVLLYTDCEDELHTSRALASALQRELDARRITASVLLVRQGSDLARWPFPRWGVLAVVVILTDVTQLSSRHSERASIQGRLISYAHRGGCLVLGHDVIYRRTRNERLQKLAGCSLDRFTRVDGPVRYVRVTEGQRASRDHALVAGMPERLNLADREVVTGRWVHDVEFLYTWADDPSVPLVTRRPVGEGRVYWMNSGDSTSAGPPRTLARPESEFVALLGDLVCGGAAMDVRPGAVDAAPGANGEAPADPAPREAPGSTGARVDGPPCAMTEPEPER